MNSIANCPVTIADVNMAEKIFGKDIASIKGKATRSKPVPVVSNTPRMIKPIQTSLGQLTVSTYAHCQMHKVAMSY
jgi:hypothetical protein